MKKCLFVLTLLAFVAFAVGSCDVTISANGPAWTATSTGGAVPLSGGTAHLDKQTKTSGCVAHGGLPDSACTPGAIFAYATVQEICTPGYSRSVRNVPYSEKDQAYAEYGIQSHYPGQYEVDHLVPLELAGSNDIANLWPEAPIPRQVFTKKIKLRTICTIKSVLGSCR